MGAGSGHTGIKKSGHRAASTYGGTTMTWTISYQFMMTATGPQWVAIGRYEPAPSVRPFALSASFTAEDARILSRFV
jgi:hypothetical protein